MSHHCNCTLPGDLHEALHGGAPGGVQPEPEPEPEPEPASPLVKLVRVIQFIGPQDWIDSVKQHAAVRTSGPRFPLLREDCSVREIVSWEEPQEKG